MDAIHDTLRFTREVSQPIDRVWAAYADLDNRSQWSVPNGEQIIYDTADFTAGGQDNYRCGPPGDLSNVGVLRYYLVESPRRFICSDTIRRQGQLMAVAVLTWELEASDHGTRITVVDQVTSVVGQGMVDGHRNGHHKTLNQLVRWLAR